MFDTCISRYPCLKVYVSYIVTESTTPSLPHRSSHNSSSESEDLDRPQQRSTAVSSHAPVVNDSAASTGRPSDVPLPTKMVDPKDHYNVDENKLSSTNISLDSDYISSALITVSSTAPRKVTVKYQLHLDQMSGSGTEPTTSYRIVSSTHQNATGYDIVELTPTTTADTNQSQVAQLYRSWDDSFLPQVTVDTYLVVFHLPCTQQRS